MASASADLLLLLTTLLAALGWIFSREALHGFEPLLFIGLRFTLASLVLLAPAWPRLARLTARQWCPALLIGLVFGAAMTCWIEGLQMATHLGVGAFLACLGVVFVPFIGLLAGDRPPAGVWLSLPCVVAGLACLSLDGDFVLGSGELLFLAAALLLGLCFTLNSHTAARMPVLPLVTIQLGVTGLLTLLLSAGTEPWYWAQTAGDWSWFLASVLLATTLRFFIQLRAQSMAPASHAAIIMTLEPIWTAVVAAWWLDEQMSGLQLTGCALIFLAMLINRLPLVRLWQRLRGREQPLDPAC